MKHWFRLALLLTLVAAMFVSAAAAEITATGTGETQVSADTAVISLGVSAQNADVLKAQQSVNERIAAVRKALTDKGVAEDCINTDYMSIYAIYDYDNDLEQVTAYNASSTLAIKVTDMNSVGELIDVAFAAGANTLDGISFSASDTEAARAESLKKAFEDAKAKAEVLAEAAGLKITGIDVITEGGVYSYDNTVGNFAYKGEAADVDAGTVVQAAKLVVSASVTVTFETE